MVDGKSIVVATGIALALAGFGGTGGALRTTRPTIDSHRPVMYHFAITNTTYKAKDGTFKGSFTAYAVQDGKMKKVKLDVSGVLIDGVGYGAATVKKAGSIAVTVE